MNDCNWKFNHQQRFVTYIYIKSVYISTSRWCSICVYLMVNNPQKIKSNLNTHRHLQWKFSIINTSQIEWITIITTTELGQKCSQFVKHNECKSTCSKVWFVWNIQNLPNMVRGKRSGQIWWLIVIWWFWYSSMEDGYFANTENDSFN